MGKVQSLTSNEITEEKVELVENTLSIEKPLIIEEKEIIEDPILSKMKKNESTVNFGILKKKINSNMFIDLHICQHQKC